MNEAQQQLNELARRISNGEEPTNEETIFILQQLRGHRSVQATKKREASKPLEVSDINALFEAVKK